ncbi:MAG: response regulator transcription factor [Alicyclobacillaceae bacterium]|nr:response regulator transcription factor [Alicyclobacillaceae bacterium]
MTPRVLVVEAEPRIAHQVADNLRRNGFIPTVVSRGRQALAVIQERQADVVILDASVPDMSWDLCRVLRQIPNRFLVLLLSQKWLQSISADLMYSSLYADEWISKPFRPDELPERVRSVLFRGRREPIFAERMSFNGGDLEIDVAKRTAYRRGREIALTPTEYRLLLVFARSAGEILPRKELSEWVLGPDFIGELRTIDAHVKNLRAKIEDQPKHPRYIKTVYGAGYLFQGRLDAATN